MSFTPGSRDDLRCRTCDEPITLEQYRRKVPRCDECEAYWLLIDAEIRYAKIEASARERVRRMA